MFERKRAGKSQDAEPNDTPDIGQTTAEVAEEPDGPDSAGLAAAERAERDAQRVLEESEEVVVPLELHQRLLAEFDNYRKRVERERERHAVHVRAELLERFLPILDDVERAKQALAKELTPGTEGLLIIMDRFADLLKREGLETIPAAPGDEFDPEVHEAVLMVPTAEVPAGSIAEVLQPGYRIADRLLRATKVAVARAPEPQPGSPGE